MTKDEVTEEEQESQRAWRRIRIFVLYPLLFLAALIGLPASFLMLRNRSAQKQVDAKLAEIRAQGQPYDNASLSAYHDRLTTTKDLSEWLEVLATVDSAEFAEVDQLLPADDRSAPIPGGEWPEREKAQAFLERWQDLLEVAQRLAQADVKRRMPLAIDGTNTQTEWATKVVRLNRFFQLQAVDAIYRRDSAATADAILNLLGCARSVEGIPMVMPQLASMVHEITAIQQLQRAIELNALAAEDLKRVRERLEARTPWQTRWQIGVVGDRAMLLSTFDQPERYLGEGSEAFAMQVPWRAQDKLNFLEITNRTLEVPTSDLTVFRSANSALNDELDKALRKGGWTHLETAITNQVLPAFGAYGNSVVLTEMHNQIGLLGIGVREYQHKFGKLPDTLDDLKEVGMDAAKLTPPGNKPFGFRKLDSSVALWGFQSRTTDSTPDDPPDLTEENHRWERDWVWQLEK